jgi:hypothetical protein
MNKSYEKIETLEKKPLLNKFMTFNFLTLYLCENWQQCNSICGHKELHQKNEMCSAGEFKCTNSSIKCFQANEQKILTIPLPERIK